MNVINNLIYVYNLYKNNLLYDNFTFQFYEKDTHHISLYFQKKIYF